jgi:transcriptional regulator with XRE-family HTH domain
MAYCQVISPIYALASYLFFCILGSKGGRWMKEKNLLKKVGKRIRYYRTQKKMSQEALAEFTDLHPTHIGKIERGEIKTTIVTLWKISQALNVPLTEIFELPLVKGEKEEKDLVLQKITALLRKQTTQTLKRIEKIIVEIDGLAKK